MPRAFAKKLPSSGSLPRGSYGELVAQFVLSSPTPINGGPDTGRHIYLELKVPSGPDAGVFECAVNIESTDLTEVSFAERTEDLGTGAIPAFGFHSGVHLSYGDGPDATYMGLADSDFAAVENDNLYQTIAGLTQGCAAVAAYGVTYTEGTGIHDIHMNSGYEAGGSGEDRPRHDGAIAFYFSTGTESQPSTIARWVFIKFDDQSIADE